MNGVKKIPAVLGEFISRHQRVFWSLLTGIIAVLISQTSYFKDHPLFDVRYLAEGLIFLLIVSLTYLYGIDITKAIGRWLEVKVTRTLSRILYEFWQVQTQRLVDAIRRQDRETRELRKKLEESVGNNAVVLDTSVLIDGRILGAIRTGFLDSTIVVTQNVVDELQYMADKKSTVKRKKGRRGLDILKEIKKACGKKKFKLVDLKTQPEEVDGSLVKYCKEHKAKIATVDYNLNKAAQVGDVPVLNVNQLANEIRMNILPGETLKLKLVQKGKEEGQALAYLDDGTMVVVKNASGLIGKTCKVIVEKVLQTEAGKMIFSIVEDKA